MHCWQTLCDTTSISVLVVTVCVCEECGSVFESCASACAREPRVSVSPLQPEHGLELDSFKRPSSLAFNSAFSKQTCRRQQMHTEAHKDIPSIKIWNAQRKEDKNKNVYTAIFKM